MNAHVMAAAFALLMPTLVQADDIKPDWNRLTDFSTSLSLDLAPLIAFAHADLKGRHDDCLGDCGQRNCDPECPLVEFPIKSESGTGTMQVDVPGERFKMTSVAQGEYSQSTNLAPPLRGAKISSSDSISFDAKSGFVFYKAKASVTTTLGPFAAEMCAKVNFPQGLLPPGQAIMAQLDRVKPKIEEELKQMPHQEVTVDGASVAVYEKPGRMQCKKYDYRSRSYHGYGEPPCLEEGDRKVTPDEFAGMMHDGTPVGYGLQGPAGGKWDSAILKFSNWTTGAGTIAEESCVTMSATELLQSPHANRSLWVFDQLMSQLKRTEPLSTALAFVPAQPSQIFASAAKLESIQVGAASLNEDGKVQLSSPSAWVTVAMAAVGGVVGAGFVLVLSKSSSRRALVQLP
jgi:hypothetical protein